MLLNQSRARAKVYHGLKYEFAGGEGLPIILKLIGIKYHPSIGLTPPPKERKKKDLSPSVANNGDMLPVPLQAESIATPRKGTDEALLAEPLSPSRAAKAELSQVRGEVREKSTSCGGLPFENSSKKPVAGLIHLDDIPSVNELPPQPVTSAAKTSPGLINPAERAHARISPSVLKAKAICPGFFSDQNGDKSAADRGTLGHKAIEDENPDLCGADQQLRTAVEKCIAYTNKVCVGKQVFKEPKLYFLRSPMSEFFGYADCVIVGGSRADLIDYKMSWASHEADSSQFHAYCLGIWDRFPEVETITVHVLMPFLDTIDEETFTRAEHYPKFTLSTLAIIAAANRNDPKDYRITDQCAFCGFAGKCPKLAEMGLEIGRRYAPELQLPDHPTLHGSEISDPETFAALLKLARPVKKAAEGWSRAALELCDKGTPIPGFAIQKKQGSRTITNPAAAYEVLKKHFLPNLTPEQFLEWCDVGATKLDEIVEGAAPVRGKSKAVTNLAALLEEADAVDFGASGRFLKATKKTTKEPST
jgi:hypothetical protein